MIYGSLTIELEDGIHMVGKEQFFRFESDQPHIYRNEGEETISFVSFFVVY